MLSNLGVAPTIPVVDLKRARAFYEEILGLKVVDTDPEGVFFDCGEGTVLYIYKSAPTKAEQTVAGFMVSDIEAEMQDLRKKGVVFEDYDLPDLKTVNGITEEPGGAKTAWFKDTEGNILALHQKGPS
ncbi:VOC family protein [Methanofollis aquaemaris]|uniref:VOC family protein n=1 Tax=Methanofollis aquaemaris TaxID=126734 RepID=A0A8A3S935_9EURY|nr:VOC family protein [Methanofollis aquaemaris]QSZ68150.1 VOC family protein [Methanofollis aquaemaris]